MNKLLVVIAQLGWFLASSPASARDERYLDFFYAYQPLSECVTAKMQTLSLTPELAARAVAAQPGFDEFAADATKLLRGTGFDHLADAVEQHRADRVRYAQGLILAMGGYGVATEEKTDEKSRMLAFQALSLSMIRMGEIPGVGCTPSAELLSLMQQVENEYL